MAQIIGGGTKKVLYTLNQVRRIGLKNSAKALNARNTCKACGLGMGGQLGGMTNESGEFPSVCNKSVQAQSTDIQAPIPKEIFQHTLTELKELSAYELEHLGRLNTVLYKSANNSSFSILNWDGALQLMAQRFRDHAAEHSFFYSSGRSSNEAGFLLQLLARKYGTNNVTNCSFYCHQATSIGLRSTIGTGTATVELNDLDACDCIFVIGANPASNHPRLIHKLKNCRERGGKVIVINPAREAGLIKFAVPKSPKSMLIGGSEIASVYLQPKIGSDLAVFKGIAKAILQAKGECRKFIDNYCDNFAAFEKDIDKTSWKVIEQSCGIARAELEDVARDYLDSNKTVFAWGMGITHHQHGCDNVEYIANLALMRGMVGKTGAGLLPLRGHSNVQGIGSVGVKPDLGPTALRKTEELYDFKVPTQKGLDTLAAIQEADKGKIKNALIVGGNLYAATPHSEMSARALNKINFKVYLTTTLNQGHLYGCEHSEVLILPVRARDEETQSTTQESMFNYVRLSDGGINRMSEARSEVEVLAQFSELLFGEDNFSLKDFSEHNNLRKGIAEIVPGMKPIKNIGKNKKEFHVEKRILHRPVFKTPNQRAQFVVHPLPDLNNEHFPFLLSSVRSEGQFNSIIYEERDTYRFNAKRNTLFMCREDMQQLGVKNKDEVKVVSQNGELLLKVLAYELPQGSVMAYYPEANVLSETKVDARSKTPNFKSIAVKIEKPDCFS